MFGMRLKRDSIGRHGRWLATIVLFGLAAPAMAEGPAFRFETRPVSGLRIDRSRLVPRVSNELESLTAFELLAQPGTGIQDHAMFEELRDKILRRGEKTTRRALRDQLLEMTGLDRSFSSGRSNRDARGPMRFTFGVHSFRPEVGLKYRLGGTAFRIRLDSSGELGLGLSRNGARRSGITATYDGDQAFGLRARLGF